MGRKRNRGSRFRPYHWLVEHFEGLQTRPDADTVPAKIKEWASEMTNEEWRTRAKDLGELQINTALGFVFGPTDTSKTKKDQALPPAKRPCNHTAEFGSTCHEGPAGDIPHNRDAHVLDGVGATLLFPLDGEGQRRAASREACIQPLRTEPEPGEPEHCI